MKEVKWNEKAKDFVRSLTPELKQDFGALLLLVQKGDVLSPPLSKPIKAIHPNAFELRTKDSTGAYRVIYVLAIKDKILIPHAFKKKTQKTPQKEIKTAQARLKELLDENK